MERDFVCQMGTWPGQGRAQYRRRLKLEFLRLMTARRCILAENVVENETAEG